MLEAGELHRRQLGEVGDPLDVRQAGAALHPRREDLGVELRARRRGDARGREQARLAQRPAAEQQARSCGPRAGRGRRLDDVSAPRPGAWDGGGAGAGSAPSDHETSAGRISVATWPGGPIAAAMASTASVGSCSVLCDVRTHFGDVARRGLDVGLQLGVVLRVVGRVVADDVDDRRLALARVVEVGEAVAQPGAEVQQRRARACRTSARSRRRRRSRRPRRARGPRASRARSRARRRSASPTCRGW